jgi:hypothetical protein
MDVSDVQHRDDHQMCEIEDAGLCIDTIGTRKENCLVERTKELFGL